MRALLIDEAAKVKVAKLKQFALDHRERLADLMRRANKPCAPGDDSNFVLHLFDGYRVVMTMEEQLSPLGWCWHISISIPSLSCHAKPYPYTFAVDEILNLLVEKKSARADHLKASAGIVEFWFRYGEPVVAAQK